MDIYVLAENTSLNKNFGCQHGLSLFIESNGTKILFDAGQDGLFFENAEKLGIDISKADIAILSHAHYDHGGGMERFFEVNKTAPLYLSSHSFEKYYSKNDKYIGLNQNNLELNNKRLVFTDNRGKINSGTKKIRDGIYICNFNGETPEYPLPQDCLTVEINGSRVKDSFLHEQYLAIYENGKKFVFSSCSHRGIANIAKWTSADIIIGGFHLSKTEIDENGKAILSQTAATLLNETNAAYYTCHCTGQMQYAYMKTIMGNRLNYIFSGQHIVF